MPNCGKSTIILQKENNGKTEYFYKLYRCKELTCPVCGEIAIQNMKSKLHYAVCQNSLTNFSTLTTSGTMEDLEKVFKKVAVLVKNIRNNINEATIYEIKHYFLYDYKYSNTAYTHYQRIAIKLSKLINDNKFEAYLDKYESKFSIKRSFYRFKSNLLSASKNYVGLEFRKLDGLKYQFYNDFKLLFDLEIEESIAKYKAKHPEDYEKIAIECQGRIKKNLDKDFEYVRILEFQKNGNPHFHILSNHYINNWILNSIRDKKSYIHDTQALKVDEEHFRDESKIVEYVSKYITKETVENIEDMRFAGKNYKVITHSIGVDVNLSANTRDIDTQGYSLYKQINGKVPHQAWGKIDSMKELDYMLTPADVEKNKYIHALGVASEDLEQEVKALRKAKQAGYQEAIKALYDKFAETKCKLSTMLLCDELEKRSKVSIFPIPYKDNTKEKIADHEQRQFVQAVASSHYNIIILSGKAGTGKTTSIQNCFRYLDMSALKVEFASFTGKAVSRINEIVRGAHGKTIHRLCNASFSSSLPIFLNGENNLLDADIIFVDELGMLDKTTFAYFLNAVKPSAKIVLIGDSNQLNPVKSNNLFFEYNLISGKYINIRMIELQNNYRSTDVINKMAQDVLSCNFKNIEFVKFNIEEITELAGQGYQIITNTNKMQKTINTRLG